MARSNERLSFIEKTGYSLGDAAANFVFMTMILFQLNFYTDTMGITAAAAGTMLLVGRLWDAFFDPMMGVLADRTNTRFGKFRPWVLWTALAVGRRDGAGVHRAVVVRHDEQDRVRHASPTSSS